MGILAALKGWKTVTGLASLIVSLLFKDGNLGDGGTVSQLIQYATFLLGGGMSIGGVIDKIKTQVAEKAAEAARAAAEKAAAAVKEKTGSSVAGSLTSGILGGALDAILADIARHPTPMPNVPSVEELAVARAKAQAAMEGYAPSASEQASAKMEGYVPAKGELKAREPAGVADGA